MRTAAKTLSDEILMLELHIFSDEYEMLFVNAAAKLNYGGYGQVGEFKPSSRSNPIIYLSGERRDMKAIL